jgi:hypothetical protein
MTRLRTYSDGKAIYSVDMMLAYVNTHKHPVVKLPIEPMAWQLEQKVWGDWSPKDVLEKPTLKKHAENAKRIKEADLSYPILVTPKGVIIDGYHRIAKAMQQGQKEIAAQVFDAALMRKFILDKDMNFVRVHEKMTVFEILELFSKRFCK